MSAARRARWWLAAWALVEVLVLVLVGRAIGLAPLLIILFAETVVGLALVRRAGRRAWSSLMRAERDPSLAPPVTGAGMLAAGGLLLALPGFLSDAAALVCLIPATRPLARRVGRAALGRATQGYADQADLLRAHLDRDSVVEGFVEEEQPRPRSGPDEGDQTIIRGAVEP